MQKQYLFIQTSEEEPETAHPYNEAIAYSDKENLIRIIHALMDSNQALRKYVEFLERSCDIQ